MADAQLLFPIFRKPEPRTRKPMGSKNSSAPFRRHVKPGFGPRKKRSGLRVRQRDFDFVHTWTDGVARHDKRHRSIADLVRRPITALTRRNHAQALDAGS